jgi:hypothetical protein
MLIITKFSWHLTTTTKYANDACGSHLETIQGGITWRLQMMDVGVNILFKGLFQNNFKVWNRNVVLVNGVKPPAQRWDIAVMVRDSVNAITEQMNANSWRKVGICFATGGRNNNENNDANDNGGDDTGKDDDDMHDVIRYMDWRLDDVQSEA